MRDRLAQASLQKKLEDLYNQAQKSLEEKKWGEAEECLQQIVGLQGNYRDVHRLLERARLQGQLATLYGKATQAWDAGQRTEAMTPFEQIMDPDPRYMDAARRLPRAN